MLNHLEAQTSAAASAQAAVPSSACDLACAGHFPQFSPMLAHGAATSSATAPPGQYRVTGHPPPLQIESQAELQQQAFAFEAEHLCSHLAPEAGQS